jgi:hypothetical protein
LDAITGPTIVDDDLLGSDSVEYGALVRLSAQNLISVPFGVRDNEQRFQVWEPARIDGIQKAYMGSDRKLLNI